MSVASKNLFALLGNDEEDDTPKAPVKTVDKTTMRSTKRNVEPQAPSKPDNHAGGARRAGPGGNEGAFRDRNAGSANNHRKPVDEASRPSARGGRGAREQGGRGGRFPRTRDDRQAKGFNTGNSEKQAAQSWGATDGDAEQKDEQVGEQIAQSELKEATTEDAEALAEAEPEDKSISYADYLAQQAEKKLALATSLEIRKPNEGTKADKKWASAKELTKEENDEFIAGSAGKAKRERERKTKQVVEIDQRYVEPTDRPRGGRGGARGGARGEGRGGRGRGEGRGEGRSEGGRGRGRGDFRGGRGGREGHEGAQGPRQGRPGREGASFNASDESAFPSLGA
ncbi:hypothetical protein SLS62_004582 [Diatrype stigma]|uniref:Hyaluronan/mRNA-binding protein domain-containing protein n=1 Tax=Diatrype stigma TaxID=117547 RepID=A0AAN9UUH7_9PEZI